MQKEDLDTPGDDRTIVTMDYMASFFSPNSTVNPFSPHPKWGSCFWGTPSPSSSSPPLLALLPSSHHHHTSHTPSSEYTIHIIITHTFIRIHIITTHHYTTLHYSSPLIKITHHHPRSHIIIQHHFDRSPLITHHHQDYPLLITTHHQDYYATLTHYSSQLSSLLIKIAHHRHTPSFQTIVTPDIHHIIANIIDLLITEPTTELR